MHRWKEKQRRVIYGRLARRASRDHKPATCGLITLHRLDSSSHVAQFAHLELRAYIGSQKQKPSRKLFIFSHTPTEDGALYFRNPLTATIPMGSNSNTYNYGQYFPPYMSSTPNRGWDIDEPLISNHHSQSTGWSIQYHIGIPMISCWNTTEFAISRGNSTLWGPRAIATCPANATSRSSVAYTITVFGSFLSKFRFAYPMSVYG